MKKILLKITALTTIFLFVIFACEKEKVTSDAENDNNNDNEVVLSQNESLITGTWYRYRSAYDYYEVVTFNRDKTAEFCRLEKELSLTANRFHERCWNWYVEDTPISTVGTEYYVKIKLIDSDTYSNAYILNTSNWTLTDIGSDMKMTDRSEKMEFDFCD